MTALQNPALRQPDRPRLPRPALQGLRVIAALMLREMGSTYGRSPGGYLWAVLSPAGSVAILALALSMVIHRPALGSSFMLFYATGYLPFDLFSQVSNRVGAAIRFSRALLAYPRVGWLDTIIARFLLALMTQAAVFILVIGGILLLDDTRAVLNPAPFVTGFAVMACCGMAAGLLNCLLTGHFPIWERLWAILRTPLLLGSGVLFLFGDMPRPAQEVLWWNPLVHGIALMRAAFYPNYHAEFVALPWAFGLPLAIIALCLPLLRSGYRAAFER